MDGAVHAAGRLRLAAELRRLRDLSGISGRELARRIGTSQSKVSRIESGLVLPTLPDVRAWGLALDVSEETQERLAFLTDAAFTEVQPWRDVMRGRGHIQDEIQQRERRARRVRTFQTSVVPGLLQTAQYARRVFATFQLRYAEEDLSAALAARLNRQQLMYEDDRQFDFLITEAALRWRPGPAKILLAQWDRIESIMTLENVSIGLIPSCHESVTTTSHGFVIYGEHADEHQSFVTVEMIHATLDINDPDDVDLYEEKWTLLQRMAIFGDDALEYLAKLTNQMRTAAE